jgi:hypothetical protein
LFLPPNLSLVSTRITATHQWSTYLLGGHWETQVGDVMKLGATYVNMFQTITGRKTKEFSLKGAVAATPPTRFYIRLQDDSPYDGDGGIILSEPVVVVNGDSVVHRLSPLPLLPAQANMTEIVEFAYDMPEDIQSISVSFIAANDFNISAAHDFLTAEGSIYRTNFTPMKQARGNVKDQSNKQVVRFEYAINTGRAIYGVNFEANLFGINLKGEYDINVLNRRFPVEDGRREEQISHAYFVQAKKRVGVFEVGGEYFNVDPEYKTYLELYTPDRSFNSAASPLSSVPDDRILASENYGPTRYWLVDDNDDNDRYEDGWYSYTGDSANVQLEYFENNDEVFDRNNPRPDAGIFPGLDENNDGIPDDDQNSNGVPDYSEPFLMYFRDPQRFDYGDDWNNNGIIDTRENDQLEDMLYRRDLQGHHLFFGIKPGRNFDLSFGVIRQRQMAGGGKTFINYMRFLYQIDWPRFGDLTLYYVPKSVEDDITDNAYVFDEDEAEYNRPSLREDPLEFRKSMVHTAYVGGNWKQIKNLKAGFAVKMERNDQKETDLQNKARLDYVGWIFPKIEYRVPLSSSLSLIPMYKIRWEKKGVKEYVDGVSESTDLFDRRWEIPILRLDWRMTRNTRLQAGFQGFTFKDFIKGLDDGGIFTYRFRDNLNELEEKNMRIFQAVMTNNTNYSGYNIWLNLGVKHIQEEFLAEASKARNSNYVQFFIQIIAGYE